MRNSIFKNELEYLFEIHKIEERVRIKARSVLLGDSPSRAFSDKGLIYQLKDGPSECVDEIEQLVNNSSFAFDLRQMIDPSDDLKIPVSLKTKILRNDKIAVFVGAGVSKLIGYPLWGELGERSIDHLQSNGRIDDFQASRIKSEVRDPKQQLSIFESFYARKDSPERVAFYRGQFKADQELVSKVNPYDILTDPIFPWIKVTSNVDLEFAGAVKGRLEEKSVELLNKVSGAARTNTSNVISLDKIIALTDSQIDFFSGNKVYHLHGTILEPSTVTFTTIDYIKKYYKSEDKTNDFLRKLFDEYTVVFMGYGLEELQILDSVIGKGDPANKRIHYSLVGTYLNELNFFNIRRKYFYESLGIELCHYYLDIERYRRIVTVLNSWRDELATANQGIYKIADYIDDVLRAK